MNGTITHAVDMCGTRISAGITATDAPSAILRPASTERPRLISQLENEPATRQPTPAAAHGSQAKAPTSLMLNPRASIRYLGIQNAMKYHTESPSALHSMRPQVSR